MRKKLRNTTGTDAAGRLNANACKTALFLAHVLVPLSSSFFYRSLSVLLSLIYFFLFIFVFLLFRDSCEFQPRVKCFFAKTKCIRAACIMLSARLEIHRESSNGSRSGKQKDRMKNNKFARNFLVLDNKDCKAAI